MGNDLELFCSSRGFRPGADAELGQNRGDVGVTALNRIVQERLTPGREGVPEARAGGRVYRAGDRVLQLKNNYDQATFNGDLGTVREDRVGSRNLSSRWTMDAGALPVRESP